MRVELLRDVDVNGLIEKKGKEFEVSGYDEGYAVITMYGPTVRLRLGLDCEMMDGVALDAQLTAGDLRSKEAAVDWAPYEDRRDSHPLPEVAVAMKGVSLAQEALVEMDKRLSDLETRFDPSTGGIACQIRALDDQVREIRRILLLKERDS